MSQRNFFWHCNMLGHSTDNPNVNKRYSNLSKQFVCLKSKKYRLITHYYANTNKTFLWCNAHTWVYINISTLKSLLWWLQISSALTNWAYTTNKSSYTQDVNQTNNIWKLNKRAYKGFESLSLTTQLRN